MGKVIVIALASRPWSHTGAIFYFRCLLHSSLLVACESM